MFKVGCLRIVDLKIEAILGILPVERTTPQSVYLSVEVQVDFSEVRQTESGDMLGLDYALLAESLKQRVVAKKFLFLENLILDLGPYVLAEYPMVKNIKISINKPAAIPEAQRVEAEMTFSRDNSSGYSGLLGDL